MADFDADAAKAAGYSDDDIARIQRGITAARAAGYSDDEIRAHLSGGAKATTVAPATVAAPTQPVPIPAASPPPPTDPGWSASRVLGDLGHYPLMALQAAANGVTGLANTPMALAGLLNKVTGPILPSKITQGAEKDPNSWANASFMFPQVDLGANAQPANSAEAYGASALAGGTAALLGGGLARVPALLQASGKEIAAALPGLLRGSVVGGAVPGVATEAANRNLDLESLGPKGQALAELGIGAAAAIASHNLLKDNPVEAVAGKLGVSDTSDHAGDVVQKAVRDWRGTLGDKIDALKGVTQGPLTPEGDVYGDKLFGKIPLDTATADMSETMKTVDALANKGGIFKSVLHEFGNDMPGKVKDLLASIAQRNNPIVEYPPKAEVASSVKSAGPVNEVPPQMTGGPMPPYGPTTPQRADVNQSLQTVPGPNDTGARAVGPALPPMWEPPKFEVPQGTVTGFRAPIKDVMALRSYVGEMTSRGMMPKGTNAAQWDALYRGLTADLGNTAEKFGARPEFDDYNAKTTQLYTDGAKLSKFSSDDNPGKDTAKPGEAVSALWNKMEKDSGDIATIRAHMPEAADEIAAAYLHNKPQNWNKLPPESQKALVPNPFDRLTLSLNAVKKPDLVTETSRNREPLIAGGIGYGLADLFEPHGDAMGSTALMSPAAWGALSLAAPPAVRLLGRIKQNPRMLSIPAMGAITGAAGANAGGPNAAGASQGSPLLGPAR